MESFRVNGLVTKKCGALIEREVPLPEQSAESSKMSRAWHRNGLQTAHIDVMEHMFQWTSCQDRAYGEQRLRSY